MNRRNFLQNTGILGAAALLPMSACQETHQPKFKLGYQLFSIRDYMAEDPIGTLKALKAMGYQDFETYGYDHENDTFYGFKSN